MEWTTEPPTEAGWYWWRDSSGEMSVVCTERSNHRPPWWIVWWLCDGCPDEGCPNLAPLDLNHDGDGPCEENYRDGVDYFAGGEWWPVPLETPK